MTTIENGTFGKGEFERFGNRLWKPDGSLKVVSSTRIYPGSVSMVPFTITPDDIPLEADGSLSENVRSSMDLHVRTRYAHIGAHIRRVDFVNMLKRIGRISHGKTTIINFPVINYGSRPFLVNEGSGMFNPFLVPEGANVKSRELEQIVGNTEDKPVFIQGEEGKDWRFIHSASTKEAEGLLLKIQDWFYIPSAEEYVDVSQFETFEQFRTWFVANAILHKNKYFGDLNHMLIGEGSHMVLSSDIYLRLGSKVYEDINGELRKFGRQTSSPLLEGFRTRHRPHFEIVDRRSSSLSDNVWIAASVIRNGRVATAG